MLGKKLLLGSLATLLALVVVVGSDARATGSEDYPLSKLRVLNRVVLLVKEQYVEPQRIDERAMLVSALEAVEKRVPEVVVSPPERDTVRISVGQETRDFSIEDVASLWELSFKLRDVFRFLETRLSPDVDRREIEYAAVNGMLSELDPHSVLLEPRSSQEMKLSTKGEFGGLGIVISIRDGALTVISPIDGTPADKVGIQALDQIVKIGEESTVNMGLDEAVERLRGKPGTEVVVWVLRKGWDAPKKFNIIRAKIEVESVSEHALGNGIGYVKIKQFQARTAEDVSKAIREIEAKAGSALSGLVLDLRNNPGGLLDQSVEVSNLFLDDGVIVVTQEGGVRVERKEVTAVPRPGKLRIPVVVLVNSGSASASEIVSGALKNRERALIIGDQTFGKGSVQQLYDFPDSSSLKLTIGQYLTPGDESIQSVGITPDVRVRAVYADGVDSVNLFPDTIAREEDLAAHLDDARTRQRTSAYELAYLSEQLDESEMQRRETTSDFVSDFEIDLAQRILLAAGQKGTTRKGLLDVAGGVVEQVRGEQDTKIDNALRALGIDWVQGPTNKAPTVAVRVLDTKDVVAGEQAEITLEVENTGSEPLHRVHGVTSSTFPYYADREFLFGRVGPGETRRFTTKIRVPKDLVSRADLMRVKVGDAHRESIASVDVPIAVVGNARPRFAYALFLDDARGGNGDGLLQVGESVDLVVSIKNTGKGAAEKPMALLKNLGGSETFIDNGRAQLSTLAPDASAIARFSFKVQEAKDELALRLQVFDSVMGDYLVEKLRFPIKTGAPSTKKVSHTVSIERPNVPVYAAADGGALVVAQADQGAKLDAVAEVGDFVRVRIGKELFGYVAAAEVGAAKGRPVVDASGVPKGLSTVFGRDPPQITFVGIDASKPLVVDEKSLTLKYTITDDGPIADAYIFVGEEKVHYQRLAGEGATDRTLETTIALTPGVNVVTVVAREDDEFAQREVLTIFSRAGDPLAEKQLIKRH